MIEIFDVDFRNRKAVASKMPGKFKERKIFFADSVQDSDRADIRPRQANDLAPRPSQFTLQRLHLRHGHMKMLLEQFSENLHESRYLGPPDS